jgi:hypothetical protein
VTSASASAAIGDYPYFHNYFPPDTRVFVCQDCGSLYEKRKKPDPSNSKQCQKCGVIKQKSGFDFRLDTSHLDFSPRLVFSHENDTQPVVHKFRPLPKEPPKIDTARPAVKPSSVEPKQEAAVEPVKTIKLPAHWKRRLAAGLIAACTGAINFAELPLGARVVLWAFTILFAIAAFA